MASLSPCPLLQAALRSAVAFFPAILAFATSAVRSVADEPMDAARLARRAALVAELAAEGAVSEVRAEAARLRAEAPGAAEAALAAANAEGVASEAVASDVGRGVSAPSRGGGVGGWVARRVVGFYRVFVGPAIGARCALDPSCSHYFLEASRRHGLLGIPMMADRFVREPAASAPDRPWVRNAAGAWRHPDPVDDHDVWFTPPLAP